jgi:hypothetical protein
VRRAEWEAEEERRIKALHEFRGSIERLWVFREQVIVRVGPGRNGARMDLEGGYVASVEFLSLEADAMEFVARCRRLVDAWNRNELDALPVEAP